MKNRQQQLSEKADKERRRCRDWLLKFMQGDQPKFLTKDELRAAAMRELDVSKLSGSGDAQAPFVSSPALLSCPSPCSSFWASWRLII
jgi:hypothetical protein